MKVLVISPHSDDASMAMGMKILDYKSKGVPVFEVLLSLGELGGDPLARKEEEINVTKLLGIEKVWFYEHPNTRFDMVRDDLKNNIESVVDLIKPDMVYTPWREDEHIDHRVVSTESLVAARSVPNIVYYECLRSKNFVPNAIFYADGKLMGKKIAAIESYLTQTQRGAISTEYIKSQAKYWVHRFHHHRMAQSLGEDIWAEVFHVEKLTNIL